MNHMISPMDRIKRSVLVVEDEEFLREGIVQLLSDAGWLVHEAGDGYDAVPIFREQPIEVVLTDLLMPRMDGIQLLRAIQDIDPDVPAVVLTGYGSIDRCVAALHAGAVDFLAKPFEEEVLLAALDRAWRGRGQYLDNDILVHESRCRFSMKLPVDGELVSPAAARIAAISRPLGYYGRRWAIRRAVEEALRNAMAHGASSAEPGTRIEVDAEIDEHRMKVAVKDPGQGFAMSLIDRCGDKSAKGRGLFLIKSFSDEARWIDPGNLVEMVFQRRGM